jgi:hypothetical protein
MTSLNPDPLIVSLVQVAGNLPVFPLALPAGALADIIDRRQFLTAVVAATTVIAVLFATLVSLDLITTGSNRHLHTAFELRDWSHMQTACDFLSINGYKLLWGPGRHGIGHNLFTYHRGPAGFITELFAELDPHERGARLF